MLTGAAVSSPLSASILSGTAGSFLNPGPDYKPRFFNNDQFEFLTALADTILPKTDSPSASEVGVPGTIDGFIFEVFTKNVHANILKNFNSLMNHLNKKVGNRGFSSADNETMLKALKELDGGSNSSAKSEYLNMKQQIIYYYLTSEEIGENYLNYLPVPGYYDPCATVESTGGKAWSL